MRNVFLIAFLFPIFGFSQQYYDSLRKSNYSVEIGFVKPDYSGKFRLNNAYISILKKINKGSHDVLFRIGYQRVKERKFFELYDENKKFQYREHFINSGFLFNLIKNSNFLGLYVGVESFIFIRNDHHQILSNGFFNIEKTIFLGIQTPLRLEFFQRRKVSFSIESALGFGNENIKETTVNPTINYEQNIYETRTNTFNINKTILFTLKYKL